MSEILTKLVVNCETGEETVVPLTSEEIAERELAFAAFEEAQAAEAAQAAAKEAAKASGIAKLLALGLTQEEAEALIK